MRKNRSTKSPRSSLTKAFLEKLCFRRIGHPELMLVRRQNSTSVFTVSEALALVLVLALAVVLVLLLLGCSTPSPQRGGRASSLISRAGQTNLTTLSQPDNPKENSRQAVISQQTMEYVLPPGTSISLGGPAAETSAPVGKLTKPSRAARHAVPGHPDTAPAPVPSTGSAVAILAQAMPVRLTSNDRVETTIGGAQKDTAREWAAKAASLQPVMWAGIAMITIVAGVLVYFGWWTKATLAVVIGAGMIALAETLPEHGTLILVSGLAVFGVAALLVLYAYHKGQLDQNNNGIPDFLERFG